ncbi:MAG TPA: MotA/TolQ/ExbB proton channel family protein [Candidatus Wallbacteria bacterium]|nr:MotA/TolQ/ExbB proton channel family protein [Candidatus Wallbacteria bacterium]
MNTVDMSNISFTIKFLLALSAFSLAFYLEKLWVVISLNNKINQNFKSVISYIFEKNISIEFLFETMLSEKSIPLNKNVSNLIFNYNIETDALIEKIKASISKLGSIAVLSPYIGLFGTVVGIMEAFAQIAKSGSSNFAVVSKGISEALVATAAGLLLAIMASFLYNHLTSKIKIVQSGKDTYVEKLNNELKYIEAGK